MVNLSLKSHSDINSQCVLTFAILGDTSVNELYYIIILSSQFNIVSPSIYSVNITLIILKWPHLTQNYKIGWNES